MQDSPIILNLKNKYSNLNPAMRQIADYIISHKEHVAYMGISQLAEASGVSIASVTRFVKELEFKNFKNFQFELARGVHTEPAPGEEPPRDLTISFEYAGASLQDGAEEISRKVFRSNIQMMNDTMQTLDYGLIDRVADRIVGARNLLFFGVGRSYLAAESGRTRFYRLGIPSFSYCDVHEQIIGATTCDERDVVIGISNYGRSASVCKSMQQAKARGATTVGITSVAGSPLAKAVDHCFLTAYNYTNLEYRSGNREYEPACENITQITLLDCLYMNVALRKEESCIEDFYASAKELEKERI